MSASSVANTAFSALQSAQAGIALTSQNVAGQAVAGYTRRKLDTGTNPVVSNSAPTLGAGVSVSGFSRDWSALLQQQRVSQAGVTAYHGAVADGLATLDNQVANPALAMDQTVNEFFTSLGVLATNPTDTVALDKVRAQGTVMLEAVANFKSGLVTVATDARSTLADGVQKINNIASELAVINRSITATSPMASSGPDPAILDRRDALLQQAGQLVGGDLGVNSDGLAYIFVDGQPLVNGAGAGQLQATPEGAGADAPIHLTMRFEVSGQQAVVNALRSSALQGSMGGQLLLAGAPSIVLQPGGIADTRLKSFTDLFAAGDGQSPAGASALTQALATLGALNSGKAGTTKTMVDSALKNLALQSNTNDATTGAKAVQRDLLQAWSGFVSNVSSQVVVHQSGQTASAAVESRLRSDFESQSGVNLDEEAANLMRYQQAYSAASKVLQANAAVLDGLLAVVGR